MEERYIQGFNAGYRIQKDAPDILKKMLSDMKGESQYIKGLQDGGYQLTLEQMKAKEKSMPIKSSGRPAKEVKAQDNKSQSKDDR